MSVEGKSLAALVDERMAAFPVSGEINSVVKDPDAVIQRIEEQYWDGEKDFTDGLSVAYSTWRFNLRKSNTEPVLRLNVESRGDKDLLQKKTAELLKLIQTSVPREPAVRPLAD